LKLELYAEQGVQEYWLVDGQIEKVEIFRLATKSLSFVASLANSDRITTTLLPGFCVGLNVFLPKT
jgi:Uma2 family endonuclease